MGFCNQLNYPALMVRHGQSQCIIRIAIQFPDLQLTGEIDTIPGWFTEKSWICNKNCEHWSHFILVCLEYVRELLEEVMQLRQDYPSLSLAERGLVAAEPHLLTESMDVVSKDDLIARYQSRYPQPETSSTRTMYEEFIRCYYTPAQRSWKGGILEWDCPSVRL